MLSTLSATLTRDVAMEDPSQYVRFFLTLAAIVDPLLAVPFFISFTQHDNLESRKVLAKAVSLTVFAVLACAVVFGESLLQLIGASLPAFRVGGGLVLLMMSLAMLNAEAGGVRQSQAEAQELSTREVKGVVPIAVPLLAGPGAISTSIIAGDQGGVLHVALLLVCIGAVGLLTWLVLTRAHWIAKRLSLTALNVGTRILGLFVAAMAIQTMADGLRYLFPVLGG
jgi:multiple antibiotic resistance protein